MKKGFTLVELLAVLVILGVITLVAVPNIMKTNENSRQKEIDEYKKTIENAAEIYVETHPNNQGVIGLVNGEELCVEKDAILEYGLLNKNLRNPQTSASVEDEAWSVMVKKVSDEFQYTYQSTGCDY